MLSQFASKRLRHESQVRVCHDILVAHSCIYESFVSWRFVAVSLPGLSLANLFQFAHLISSVSSCCFIKRFSYNGTYLYSRKAIERLTDAYLTASQAHNCGSLLTCVAESGNLNVK